MRWIIIGLLGLLTFQLKSQTFDWVQTISQGGNNHVWDMVSTADGSIYATGRCKFSVTFGRGSTSISSSSIGETDIFLLKLNPDSTVAWVKRMGGINPDWGRSIELSSDNFLYLTGEFANYAVFENDTIYGYDNGATDPFAMARSGYVAKYTLDGDLVWVKPFVGDAICKGYAISTDSLGNCYVTGVINGLTDFGNGVVAGENNTIQFGFIAKYDSSGNCLYATHIDGSTGSVGNDIHVMSNNQILLTGFYKGTMVYDGQTFTGTSITWGDMYAMMVDSNANLIWNKTANSPFLVVGNGISFDKSKNVYVSGTFTYTTYFDGVPYTYTGTGSTSSTINANADGFIVKYNEQGVQQWVNTFQNDAMVSMDKLCIDGNKVYSSGQISDTLFFNSEDTLLVPGNTASGFLICTDTSGSHIYSKLIKGSAPSPLNYTKPIVIDQYHNVYLGGGFKGTGTWDHQYINAGSNNDAFVVKMFPLIEPEISDVTAACLGDTLVITSLSKGAPLVTGWIISGSPNIIFESQDSLIYVPGEGGVTDTILFIASNPYETDTAYEYIEIESIPFVNLGGDTSICDGYTLIVDAGTANYSFDWGTGLVLNDSLKTITAGGAYSVNVISANGCMNSDTILVTINDLPYFNLGPDLFFCESDSVQLTAGSLGNYVDWGAGFELNDTLNYFSQSGLYVVTVLDENDCSFNDTINLVTSDCLSVSELDESLFSIYPNPFVNEINLNLNSHETPFEIRVWSLDGVLVYENIIYDALSVFDLSKLSKGSYYIEIISITNQSKFLSLIIKL